VAASWWPVAVRADELVLTSFHPTLARGTTLRIDSPELAPHGTVQLGLALDYGHALLERRVGCLGGEALQCRRVVGSRALVSDLARAELLATLSLYDALELGVALPLVFARAAPAVQAPLDATFGLGDVRATVGIPLVLAGDTRVATRIELGLPTARAHTWSGSPGWTVLPSLVITHQVSRLTLAAKLGYQLRDRVVVFDVEQDDEYVLHLGAALITLPALTVISDVSARLGVGGLGLSKRELALEVDLGARLRWTRGTSLELGVGTNALPANDFGFVPALRAQVVLRGTLGESERSREASRADGSADADRDGLVDDIDVCPHDAEDHDGFADDDGCPDGDNDADGFSDARDMCPDRSEDRDGFQDSDGCPDLDNDDDGVPDGADRCRRDPEDRDGFEDDDGCPEPGPGRPVVTVSGSRILLSDNIYFEDEADTIRAPSVPLLDELARTLIRLPASKRVRVEGHTDAAGSVDHNIDLSYRRARAVVEYLVARGVPADRLEHVGYGGTRPLADNRTPEGRALNRRVQFTVLDPGR